MNMCSEFFFLLMLIETSFSIYPMLVCGPNTMKITYKHKRYLTSSKGRTFIVLPKEKLEKFVIVNKFWL